MPVPRVVLERFTYSYPVWSDRPAPVLRGVDLRLGTGATVVAGESGAGKSTLLRVLNGLVPHFHGGRVSGRVTVCGMNVITTPTRELGRQVGFVFQEPEAGFVRGTVAREVAFGPENLGLPPAVIRRQIGEALERVGIAGLSGRRLRTLSGGERQRVALAAALACGPSVLVMDEPMSQLDESGAHALAATIGDLARSGRTVVVAEQQLGRLPCADRVVAVVDGRLEEVAPPPWDDPAGDPRPVTDASDGPAPTTGGPGRAGPAAWSLEDVTVGVAGRPLIAEVGVSGWSGDVVVVTGPNGSGKTTLLRTIAGLAPPLAGRAEHRPGRVAYLPQEPGVLLHRHSVRAEIDQTLRWSQGPGRPEAVLELLGLADLADRDPRDLSVGQRQRAALAVVLAGHPAVALLDEPTRGMDAAARRGLTAALRWLAEDGTAVVLATHDTRLAGDLGGRHLHIEDGRLRCRAPSPPR